MSNVKAVPSFGKFPVMECRVKQAGCNYTQKATLYELNPNSKYDLLDVRRSKNTNCIKDAFTSAFAQGDNLNHYYIMQDNDTKEVISCAQVARKYRAYGDNIGFSTQIRAMEENKKFKFGLQSMLAYFAKLALDRNDIAVYAPYNKYDSDSWSQWSPYDLPSLEELKVKDVGKDGICIPSKGFYYFIDSAARSRKIKFLV